VVGGSTGAGTVGAGAVSIGGFGVAFGIPEMVAFCREGYGDF